MLGQKRVFPGSRSHMWRSILRSILPMSCVPWRWDARLLVPAKGCGIECRHGGDSGPGWIDVHARPKIPKGGHLSFPVMAPG